jgi:hypothetical protein
MRFYIPIAITLLGASLTQKAPPQLKEAKAKQGNG